MVDNWIQRAIIVIAAVLSFAFGGCIIWIAIQQRNVPDVVQMAYVGAAGFLFGVLTNMRTGHQPEEPPQQVEVVNVPANPVPTTDAS